MKVLPFVALAILAASFIVPAFAQGVSVSSTSQSNPLVAVSVPESVTFSQSHVVQPVGHYKPTPSGAFYASNSNENVSIVPQFLVGPTAVTFSSYQANQTNPNYFVYSSTVSGCTLTNSYKQEGANSKETITGSGCPLSSYKMKIASIDGTIALYNATTKTIVFSGIAYTWQNDIITGASLLYSAGILTITSSSANWSIDPTIVQSVVLNSCDSAATCTATFGSTPANGDDVIVGVSCRDVIAAPCGLTSVTASGFVFGSAIVSQSASTATINDFAWVYSATCTNNACAKGMIVTPNSMTQNIDVYSIELSGLSTTAVTGVGTCVSGSCSTSIALSSTSFTYPAYFAWSQCATQAGGQTFTAGATFTKTTNGNQGIGEYSSTVTSPTTFPLTSSMLTPDWACAGAVFAGLINQETDLVLLVNPSPSPDGGAIYKQSTSTTISSSTIVTMTAGSTFALTAQEFAGYIWNGWTGATASIQDTINPTQTFTFAGPTTSYTTSSTISSTLTANFAVPSSGSSGSPPNYDWLILFPFIIIAIALAAKKR